MYHYDQIDRDLVQARVDEFRDQVRRRISGELTEDQFKPLRLMNGLYLQLHAYMLRVAIPYGTLSSAQLRALATLGRDYDRGYGHVTTRQNMQFNWVGLGDVPDALQLLADHDMHAIQTSGNTIRNTTTDPFAGATDEEIEDPRVWCEVIRQWSTLHPEFSFLPRKFKIAVTAAQNDRAATQVHDIGLQLYPNEDGEAGFRVLVGGGLGRTPYVGELVRDFLPKEHLLSYLEAILRVYNMHGRRDNLYKARIKILVNEMGTEAFREAVEEEWQRLLALGPGGSVDLPDAERARIAAFFKGPDLTADPDGEAVLKEARADSRALDRWAEVNLHPHKVSGHAIVTISLKPIGKPPGDITSNQMDALADLADQYGQGEIRTTHEQNMVLPHVRQADIPALYQALEEYGLASPNAGRITDIVACPGLDYCNLANTRSIPIANQIQERFDDLDRERTIGELKIKISGCINACGHHHVGHIGILGVDKKGEEFYQVTLGGASDEQAAIGTIVGRGLSADEVVEAIDRVVRTYLDIRRDAGERFIDTYRRLGAEPFKEALYAEA
ncbi:nitrite/sulfite reductase [Parvularcula marina]|uniref:Nitrite/sulfite reductase n=1 Tax=Parvularcula marina TaxID=2292771 RepID=A0A371RJB6_9PROT|nr:nitrite/sulfite reductase [Parvularcula marina]RFB05538.1 nitrite/sulfite reductase [Parvularcula marina]